MTIMVFEPYVCVPCDASERKAAKALTNVFTAPTKATGRMTAIFSRSTCRHANCSGQLGLSCSE